MQFDEQTKLMLHFNGTDGATSTEDESESGHTITFADNAQLDDAQKKFGSTSLLVQGTNDYISILDHEDWNFGAGDFTIDCQMRLNVDDESPLYNQEPNGSNYIRVTYIGNSIQFSVRIGNVARADYSTTGLSFTTGVWYHIAVVRNGTDIFIFVDGVSASLNIGVAIGSYNIPDLAATIFIGSDRATNFEMNGWIDEFRISKGIARWTSNFTAPTSEYVGTEGGVAAGAAVTLFSHYKGIPRLRGGVGRFSALLNMK